MLVPKGSIISIENVEDKPIEGVLAEDVTIQLKSNFKPMINIQSNSVTDAIDMLGSTTRYMFGGKGFSSQYKQFSTQVWDKTDPIRIQLNVDFHRVPIHSTPESEVSGENVMRIIKKFCQIPLPEEGLLGILTPPGPSPIEGIGLDELGKRMKSNGELTDKTKGGGLVNLTIGSMKFRRLIMESAEPTFSKYTDDSKYPISCRVAFSFVSIWAATKQMVQNWSGEDSGEWVG